MRKIVRKSGEGDIGKDEVGERCHDEKEGRRTGDDEDEDEKQEEERAQTNERSNFSDCSNDFLRESHNLGS
jgi:hypothetical protein